MNAYDQMRQSVSEAKQTLNAADNVANELAALIEGRLRKVSSGYVLRKLKRELRDFNMTTSSWKD